MHEDEVNIYLEATSEAMDRAVDHLRNELMNIRAGKATPGMVEGVRIDYYGSESPLNQVASISTPDAHTIVVQPWEKSLIATISKAIIDANLGFNPSNDGSVIHINVPTLTEERRRDLVKRVHSEGEQAKIGVRNARKDGNDEIRKLKKDGLSEDLAKDAENDIQALTDRHSATIDDLVSQKEKEIMTV